MPLVTTQARGHDNGEIITEFTDSVGTTATTYTYPTNQDGLTVRNEGVTALTLTVNGDQYTITPNKSQLVAAPIISFTIVSTSGNQQFSASSWFSNTGITIRPSGIDAVVAQKDVVIAAAVSATSPWIDVGGYNRIGVSLKNNGSTANEVKLRWSNDGATYLGVDEESGSILANTNSRERVSKFVEIKARYAAIETINRDAAAPHTFTTTLQLKKGI